MSFDLSLSPSTRTEQLPTISSPAIMSIPSPVLSPEDFLAHVTSLGLDVIITPFVHYQNRPLPSIPGGRYDEGAAQEWCERMDTFLVCFYLSQHPPVTYIPPGQAESRSDCASNPH